MTTAEALTAAQPVSATEAAISGYLARGWAVVPLHSVRDDGSCTCSKPACSSPGKHPIAQLVPDGFKSASQDGATVQHWLDNAPWMNVGLPTGRDQGFVVVDVDPDHGGMATIGRLEERYGTLPETFLVHTGGGGLHLYFAAPPKGLRNSAGRVGPGVDVRGDGGYVVAAPSRHRSGYAYEVADPALPILPMPGWLLAHAQADIAPARPALRSSRRGDNGGLIGWAVRKYSQPRGEGARNQHLASFGGSLRRLGADEAEIADRLLTLNQTVCSPPLPEREVLQVARSVSRYPAGTPA